MSTREDVKTFFGLPLDFSMLELEPETDADLVRYFCTPENAEIIGWGSCGTHFVLLPGDEAVYCVEPELAEEGTFVLPVGADFREFVSHLLYCKCTSPLAQIFMLDATRFRKLLEDNAANTWPGCEEGFKSGDASLALLAENRARFHAANLEVVAGTAPEALEALSAPDRVFLGGTSGSLEDILNVIFRKNPAARVVCTAVTLETVGEAARCFAGLEGADMVQVAVTRTRPAGRYHLMDAQNPVWIFSGEGRA